MILYGSLIAIVLITFVNAEEATGKAASLGLTQTWKATIPDSAPASAVDYVTSNWSTTENSVYGAKNIDFVQDPISNNGTVLKVSYPKGSFAPVGTKTNTAVPGGVEFYSMPNDSTYNTAFLGYDLAFDSTFDWVKGGKLPGIYGGTPGQGCSGGDKATGDNCFSVRLMWRGHGAGEAYAYIPTSDSLCDTKQVFCNNDYGTSFSRGIIQFSTMKWSRMEIYVKLNSGSNTNGALKVWQDGSLVINQPNIQFRSSDSVGISSLMFSTFFGGGSTDYATQVDTSTYFRNIEFSAGNTPDPTGGNTASALSISTALYALTVLTVLTHQLLI